MIEYETAFSANCSYCVSGKDLRIYGAAQKERAFDICVVFVNDS
jgi:hypothetical protein